MQFFFQNFQIEFFWKVSTLQNSDDNFLSYFRMKTNSEISISWGIEFSFSEQQYCRRLSAELGCLQYWATLYMQEQC